MPELRGAVFRSQPNADRLPQMRRPFQVVELAHSRPKWAPSPPVAIKTPVVAVDPFEAETAEPEVEDEDAQDEVEIPPIEEDEDD